MNVDALYKEFLEYKTRSVKSYINIAKKIRSFEDLRYTLGLMWFCSTKILLKPRINNETVRGR